VDHQRDHYSRRQPSCSSLPQGAHQGVDGDDILGPGGRPATNNRATWQHLTEGKALGSSLLQPSKTP
jgi:hypothetical protein